MEGIWDITLEEEEGEGEGEGMGMSILIVVKRFEIFCLEREDFENGFGREEVRVWRMI